MDDTVTSSSLTYHPVTMTINGVTKSVLVPLPKSSSQGRPVAAKLPDGSAIVMTPNSRTDTHATTVAGKNNATLSVNSSYATTSTLLARQHPVTVSVLGDSGSAKRPVITLKPVINSYRLFGGRGTIITTRPRLTVSTSRAVAVECPSGERRVVHIAPPSAATDRCIRIPVALVRPTTSTGSSSSSSSSLTRPIILRKNQPPISRSAYAVVVRSCTQPRALSAAKAVDSLSRTSALTVVSSPRTLSRHEAIAAGWYAGSDVDEEEVQSQIHQTSADDSVPPTTLDDPPPYAVRHIVPMDTADYDQLSGIGDNLQHDLEPCPDSPADQLCDDTDAEPAPNDDRIVVVDNETRMKVIEIFPDDADIARDHGDISDVKPALQIKNERSSNVLNALADDDFGRRCSSVSTETTASDAGLSTVDREDFVVLAEWSQDESPTISDMTDKPAADTGRRNKRRKRKSKRYSWFRYRRTSPTSVYKARRTGGRPKTVEERYGIVDSFVSLPVMRLTKPFVDVRSWWRYVCCHKNQIQRCRCVSVLQNSVAERDNVTVTDGSKIHELIETTELIQPSLLASDCATLPVQLSGPTSVDGVTPLLVRQPDGKLASVVAKRTTPAGTTLDANKKKYLLIKSKTGSFLVPVNSLADAYTGAVPTPTPSKAPPTPPLPPTSYVRVKPDADSDSSGHRERIQKLKEQLRQHEEQLNSIRSQLNCNAVHKFDLDSIRY